jgi:hypothetical protein
MYSASPHLDADATPSTGWVIHRPHGVSGLLSIKIIFVDQLNFR